MLKKFLEKNFPELRGHVYGENYPPPQFAVYLVQFVQSLQIFAVISMLFAERIYVNLLGFPTIPAAVQTLRDNQLQAFIILFVMSSLAQGFMSTGAFEIEVNGELIFSKLATGSLPNLQLIAKQFVQKGVQPLQPLGFGGI